MRASRANVAGLHDTATTVGTADAASARACASAPWRGGSNTTTSNGFSSAAASGRRNRSRASIATGFRPCVVSAARLSAATASLSVSTAVMRARSASRSANGPTPANRSAIRVGLAAMLQHQRRQCGLAGRGRLQERPRRERYARAAHGYGGRRALHDDLAMARETRQLVLGGDARQRGCCRHRQRSRSAQVDVETVLGRGHLDIERLAHASRWSRRSPRRPRPRRRARAPGSGNGRWR